MRMKSKKENSYRNYGITWYFYRMPNIRTPFMRSQMNTFIELLRVLCVFSVTQMSVGYFISLSIFICIT